MPERANSAALRSQKDSLRCPQPTVDLRDHRSARIRPCRASHLHLVSTVQSHLAGSYEGPLNIYCSELLAGTRNTPTLAAQCRGHVAAPHYGLRYGSALATGDFQRLRGRPPLVSPLKSCMGRSFTAVTRVQIPSGTPNLTSSLSSSQEARKSCMIDVFCEFKNPIERDHTKPCGKSIGHSSRRSLSPAFFHAAGRSINSRCV